MAEPPKVRPSLGVGANYAAPTDDAGKALASFFRGMTEGIVDRVKAVNAGAAPANAPVIKAGAPASSISTSTAEPLSKPKATVQPAKTAPQPVAPAKSTLQQASGTTAGAGKVSSKATPVLVEEATQVAQSTVKSTTRTTSSMVGSSQGVSRKLLTAAGDGRNLRIAGAAALLGVGALAINNRRRESFMEEEELLDQLRRDG